MAARAGWPHYFTRLGWQWEFSPHGLQGILLAHVFFNMPMATRLLLQALENIPGEQRQIAAQLGMRGYAFFRLVEWPWLRRHIPAVAALIFMLCFASFATVLSLGGGPKATTIELAIYQALSFDYDPARAVMLALIQMLCCLGLVLLSQRLSKAVAIGVSHVRGWRDPDDRLHSRLSDGLLIGAALLLLLPPLLAVIVDGSTVICWTCWRSQRLAGIEHLSTHRHRRRAIERDPDDDAVMEQPGAARSPAAVGRAGNGAERHADPCDAGNCAGDRLLPAAQ